MEAFLSIIKKYNGIIRIYPEDSVMCIEIIFDVNTINSLYK
jgi:hypothetical protein